MNAGNLVPHLDSLLAKHGAAGCVRELEQSARHGLRARTMLFLGALMRTDATEDHVAVATAGGAHAITNVMTTIFPGDLAVESLCLGALFRVWGGGVAPFDRVAVPTAVIVQAILDVSARHKANLHIHQAALRLLKLHCQSSNMLILAPAVMSVVARAMRAFPSDDAINHYGAEAVSALNGVEPHDVTSVHGQSSYLGMCSLSIELAMRAARPTTLFVAGKPWHDQVMRLYPRLRSQAR